MTAFLKTILDLLQCVFLLIFTLFFKVLPARMASNVAGWIGRVCLAPLPISRRAYRNLQRALPTLTPAQQTQVVRGMWDNLMRTLVEYLHLNSLDERHIQVIGAERIQDLRDDGKPAILFLAHLGNWELATLVGLRQHLDIVQLYRKLNYPLTDAFINWIHRRTAQEVITKGPEGARDILRALKDGRHVSMLLDQKLNEGEDIPLFGHLARTPSSPARLALQYECPFVPIQVERIKGVSFRVTYHPPIVPRVSGDRAAQVTDMLHQMNAQFEDWIRAHPEQWLWLHNRWPKGA